MSRGLVKDQDNLPIVVLVFPCMQDDIEEIHELLALCLCSDHEQRRFQYVGTANTAVDGHRLKCWLILGSMNLLVFSLPGFSFKIIHLYSGLIHIAYRIVVDQQRQQLPCYLSSVSLMLVLISN